MKDKSWQNGVSLSKPWWKNKVTKDNCSYFGLLFQAVLSLKAPSHFFGGDATFIAGRTAHHQITHWSSWSMNIRSHFCQLLTSRALVFILPPSSVPAFGGTDDTQSSTNPAGTKLTCFWRILIQQHFAPGGCSTFDPILAGARSDLQYLELCAQSLLWSWHELFYFSFWAALVFSASFRRIAFQNQTSPACYAGIWHYWWIFWGQKIVVLFVWFPRVLQLLYTFILKWKVAICPKGNGSSA